MTSNHDLSEAAGTAPPVTELRLRALHIFLTENGYLEPAAIGALINTFGSRIDPNSGAQIAALAEPDLPVAQVGGQAMLAIPRNGDGPVFRESWEVLAFALAMALAERGAFTWAEWAEVFGGEIMRAGEAGELDQDAPYYRCWLAALERMVVHKGLAERATAAR